MIYFSMYNNACHVMQILCVQNYILRILCIFCNDNNNRYSFSTTELSIYLLSVEIIVYMSCLVLCLRQVS